MNKHDKLTVAARDMAGQENCDGPEYDMIIELTDLLQLYGDALVEYRYIGERMAAQNGNWMMLHAAAREWVEREFERLKETTVEGE